MIGRGDDFIVSSAFQFAKNLYLESVEKKILIFEKIAALIILISMIDSKLNVVDTIVEVIDIIFDVSVLLKILILLMPLIFKILFSLSGAFGLLLILLYFACFDVDKFENKSKYILSLLNWGFSSFYLLIILILLITLYEFPLHKIIYLEFNSSVYYLLLIGQIFYVSYAIVKKIIKHNSLFKFTINR